MNPARPCLAALMLALAAPALQAQQQQAAKGSLPEPKNWTTAEDHQHMMEQLGHQALRPGPSGNEQAPNHANYDEAKANPFPVFPDVLTLKNGQKVTTRALWARRRAEIVEDFEREVFGRIPKNVPKVTWTVDGDGHGHDWWPARDREAAHRARRQLGVSADQRRHLR